MNETVAGPGPGTALVSYTSGPVALALPEALRTNWEAKTPRREIKRREGPGGLTLYYVEGVYVIRRLNEVQRYGGYWSFSQKENKVGQKEVAVLGCLTIHFAGMEVSFEDWGSQIIRAGMEAGDALKAATTDSLKRCAHYLGIALDLYDKTELLNTIRRVPSNEPSTSSE